jgi:nucleoside-diphosphate-sugar epimerase
MTRVLVTGGAGTLGAAVVRRLLREPDYWAWVQKARDVLGWEAVGPREGVAEAADRRRATEVAV